MTRPRCRKAPIASTPLTLASCSGVSHLGFTTYYGEFPNVSGSLNLKPKAVDATTLEIHIPTASVSTGNAKLNGELTSDQWLDSAKFPEIVFKADKITETGK